jgi:hypothetical protein
MAQSIFFPQRPVEYSFTNSVQVTITHNLGYIPNVQIMLEDGTLVYADVKHNSNNELVLTFANAKTGSVVLR